MYNNDYIECNYCLNCIKINDEIGFCNKKAPIPSSNTNFVCHPKILFRSFGCCEGTYYNEDLKNSLERK